MSKARSFICSCLLQVLSSFPGCLPIHVTEIKKLIEQDDNNGDEDR